MPKEKSPRSLVSRFFGFIWGVVKFILTSIFLFIGLFVIIEIYQSYQEESQACDELSIQTAGSGDFAHARSWKSLEGRNNYCMSYTSEAKINKAFSERRNDIQVPQSYWSTDNGYWGYIYQSLLNENGEAVDYIADSLIQLAHNRDLSRTATADLIVTFVQDIPYVLITNKPCEPDYEGPCRPNETYGILSPYEFLYSLEGDCDTRSVLLYSILKRAGFQPIIVVSEAYAHAMIALDISASGDYIEYKRQRFYFWETTSQGWKPGMLPPSTNNVKYWKIALAHEL